MTVYLLVIGHKQMQQYYIDSVHYTPESRDIAMKEAEEKLGDGYTFETEDHEVMNLE